MDLTAAKTLSYVYAPALIDFPAHWNKDEDVSECKKFDRSFPAGGGVLATSKIRDFFLI